MGGVGVSVIGCACLGVLVYVVSVLIGRGMTLVCVKGMGANLGGGGIMCRTMDACEEVPGLFLSLHSSLQLPTIIADNAGFDSSDLMTRLRAAHSKGPSSAGIGRRGRHEGGGWGGMQIVGCMGQDSTGCSVYHPVTRHCWVPKSNVHAGVLCTLCQYVVAKYCTL